MVKIDEETKKEGENLDYLCGIEHEILFKGQ